MEENYDIYDSTRYMHGPFNELAAIRLASKDNADGTVTLSFKVNSSLIPYELSTSPEGSSWLIELRKSAKESDEVNPITAILTMRMPIRDLTDGMAELRFSINASAARPENIYGNKGDAIFLGIAMVAGKNPHPYLIDKTERAAVLTRCSVICHDPAFEIWLDQKMNKRNLTAVPKSENISTYNRNNENLYRLIGIHSKREILTSTMIAQTIETLLRNFRDDLYTQNNNKNRQKDVTF